MDIMGAICVNMRDICGITGLKNRGEIVCESSCYLSGCGRERTIRVLETRYFILSVALDDSLVKELCISVTLNSPSFLVSLDMVS
jgi:hypothetical protein